MKIKNSFSSPSDVWFKETDLKKIRMTSGKMHVVSTVCPDYPHDGGKYTFCGQLGSGISLTAHEHLCRVPPLLETLSTYGFDPVWHILVADLPEVVDSQQDFLRRVCGGKEEYLDRCAQSARVIQKDLGQTAIVKTFSDFYREVDIDYLTVQESVARKVAEEGKMPRFKNQFHNFAESRRSLAEKFRGRRLMSHELTEAAAHGMSLYITHGTLLRSIFIRQNLMVVNHRTLNLQNFFLSNFVSGYEHLVNTPKFPLGILEKEFY